MMGTRKSSAARRMRSSSGPAALPTIATSSSATKGSRRTRAARECPSTMPMGTLPSATWRSTSSVLPTSMRRLTARSWRRKSAASDGSRWAATVVLAATVSSPPSRAPPTASAACSSSAATWSA
jgi:hypothetical protein